MMLPEAPLAPAVKMRVQDMLLSSLFAFEFGQPFSHLFGSEALKVVFSAGGEGLQGSATRVLAKYRRFSTAKNSRVSSLCTGCGACSELREAWLR